jgi:amino acid adenylation domain-containing protein
LTDLASRLAALSPEQRELLTRRLGRKAPAAPPPPVPVIPRHAGPAPLSFAQQRLWFIDQLAPGSPLYNNAVALRAEGPLDSAVLALCFGEIVRRHEVLRTVFIARDGTPVQVARPAAPFVIPLVDLSRLPESRRERRALALIAEETGRPFDLAHGPLLRVVLLRLAGEDHAIALTMHHIVSDGWSMGILVRELTALYPAFAAGQPPPLPELSVQYADFAAWQRSWLQGEIEEREIAFWREQLAGLPSRLELPTDRPRAAVQSFRGAWRTAILPAGLTRQLEALAWREGATLFMVLLAAFQALLSRYSGQQDLAVGSPVAGRNRSEIEDLIGFFINMLVLRGDLSGAPAFRELLGRTRDTALAAYLHQDVPFEKLVEELEPERSLAHAPLFQVMFVLQNAPVGDLEIRNLLLRPVSAPASTAKLDLTVVLEEHDGGLNGTLEYATDLFDPVTIDRLFERYGRLLTGALADLEQPIQDLALLSAAERHQLVLEWGGTAGEPPVAPTLHGLFEAQVRRAPDAAALTWDGMTLTYGALNRRSNRLAFWLRRNGVGPESRVGLCLERSADLVVGILGILKAGGAYVPLDPGYPQERLAFVIQDAGVDIVVGTKELDGELLDALPDEDLAPRVHGANLAYILYTSGSTGRPKGTLVTHGNVARLFTATEAWFGFGERDVWPLFHSFAFDFSVWEIWGALLHGGRLVVVPYEVSRSPGLFLDLLVGERVTVLNQTPSAFAQLARVDEERGGAATGLRLVIFGGEALDPAGLASWFDRHGDAIPRLINMYGITETTVHVTYRPLRAGDAGGARRNVIGVPLPDLSLGVMDRGGLQPAPAGVPGELVVGGAGLARGYLSRPDLTAERFVPDPSGGRPGARLYRSGDLGRFLPGGGIEYLGRIDRQVKIRGFRIELGEIEAALVEAGARESVVVVREDRPGDPRLVAYGTGNVTPDALRRRLRERLPDHMVPAVFVMLPELPLTPNGKVDRKVLPAPAPPERPVEEARNEVERAVAGIWCEVLDVPWVGSEANFFDLGGHSMLLPRVQARLRDQMGREVSLVELLTHTTVRALARHLEPGEAAPASAVHLPVARAPGGGAIAVVGLSGRFPGASGVEQLWANLCAGISSIARFSDEELAAAGVPPELRQNPHHVPAGGVLDGVELFDAGFFGYSPREAELLDPQQRVFLECAWEALENAGYDARRLPGPAGVFASLGFSHYLRQIFGSVDPAEVGGLQLLLGNDKDFLATRVSYKLDLTGPSMTVQTACSSSLVAVHLACRELLHGTCDLALAGGVSILLPQRAGYLYAEGSIASPDGCCRAFDAEARGSVSGSGVGIVVLKRLEDAVAHGDAIRAVILGSAVNNDGGSGKAGYTAPSVGGQAAVITAALETAGVDPATVSYVEAHGTGTALGDPVEVQALAQAFRRGGARERSCALGSVKTNLGHLDAAAGITGLIKTALALEHRVLPPSLGFAQPNPQIDFAAGPFHVQAEATVWERGATPRRAGVSSFGIGGTNAHAVLEEPPVAPPSESARPWHLLVLSARTPEALERKRAELADHLDRHPEIHPADAAYTLQLGRRPFSHRCIAVVRDATAAAAVLRGEAPGRLFARTAPETAPPVVFLFPGQGSQRPGMGAGLYRTEPVFRREVDRCCEILLPILGFDLREPLLAPADSEEAAGRLAATEVTQPALFVIEHALAHLWMEWGVRPQAQIGHSIGEYVAACLAGVVSLEDALALVAARGRLIASLPPGAMLAVSLPEADAARWAEESRLAVAAVNAPDSCVLSGPVDAVEQLAARLSAEEIEHRRLPMSHAFHSPALEPVLERFREEVGRVGLQPPRLLWISNLSGTWIRPEEATDPGYWTRHLREAVRFADGVEELLRIPGRICLEVGPGRSLSTLVRRRLGRSDEGSVLASLPSTGEQDEEVRQIGEALGRLWLAGAEINWPAVHAHEARRRVPLPAYPFERQRYWIEGGSARPPVAAKADRRREMADWLYLPSWRRTGPPARPADAAREGPWLLFVDAGGGVRALAERLERSGRRTVIVEAGDRFARRGDGSFTLDPERAADYAALLTALRDEGREPAVAVHGWSLARRTEDAGFERAQALGLYSVLYLIRALAGRPPGSVRLAILANGLEEVSGAEELRPEQAGLLAAARVAPQENPGLACRLIDLERVPAARSREIDLLFAELAGPEYDPLVAWRGGHRWVQEWKPVPGGEPIGEPIELRPRGVYLITGGFGKVGLTLAEMLAESVQARLVLLGRTPLPERSAWPQRLLDIEAKGGEILPLAVDVADRRALTAAVREAEQRFGRLDGAIHAAAQISFQTVEETGPAECAAVFHAKVHGARALAEVLRGRDLDFVLAFSSISSLLGGLGFAAYAVANLCLDAFVLRHRRETATPWISVCWDRWRFPGSPGPAGADRFDTAGSAMTPEEGKEIFRRILALGPPPHLALSVTDLEARLDRWVRGAGRPAPLARAVPPAALHARPELPSAYEPPRDETESILAGLWQALLGVDRIGVHDNFFELGGHSLMATQLLTRIRETFGATFSLRVLFERPTVAELAAVVEEARRGGRTSAAPRLVPVPREGPLPLSFAQQRLWFVQQLDLGSSAYNVPIAVKLEGRLDAAVLERCFTEVIRRHEALRTTFANVEGEAVQVIAPEGGAARFVLPRIGLSRLGGRAEAEALRLAMAEARRPFDLRQGPLLRALLLELGPTTHILVATIHHIVSDGWSMELLVGELIALFGAFSAGRAAALPELPVQYADYASWQRARLRGEVFAAHIDFWREQLAGLPDVLELPAHRPRPAVPTARGGRRTRLLGTALERDLRDLGSREGCTLFMTALAGFQAFLACRTGRGEILVGSPTAGRNHSEIEGLIGCFVNLLPLRADLGAETGMLDHLRRVRRAVLDAQHHDVPFDLLVEKLRPRRGLGYNPIVQVAFTLQEQPQDGPEAVPGLTLTLVPLDAEGFTVQFDLTLNMVCEPQGLVASIDYSSDLFDAATIDRWLADLEYLLRAWCDRPDAGMPEIREALAATEQQRRKERERELREARQERLKRLGQRRGGDGARPRTA